MFAPRLSARALPAHMVAPCRAAFSLGAALRGPRLSAFPPERNVRRGPGERRARRCRACGRARPAGRDRRRRRWAGAARLHAGRPRRPPGRCA
eukprot:5896218-Alexandrium_andersonii.AAC.1